MHAMPNVPIEDDLGDVLGKAMRGLGLDSTRLAERSGLDRTTVELALRGEADPQVLTALAAVLDLSAQALCAFLDSPQAPEVDLPSGLVMQNTAHPVPGYAAMTVNNYFYFPDSSPGEAVGFDSGNDAQATAMLLSSVGRRLTHLMLTHTHHDHIAAISELRRQFGGLEIYGPSKEPMEDVVGLHEGMGLDFSECRIRFFEVAGHSPGGLIYRLDGLAHPVAIVGDTIFCRSIGKVAPALYSRSLELLRRWIRSAPETTLLCPGHGPVTTVAFERAHNPFFAS